MYDWHYSHCAQWLLHCIGRCGLRLSLTLALITLCACQPQTPSVYKTQIPIFGTLVEVSIKDTTPAAAQQAFTEIQGLFQQLHFDWHPWLDGELDRLNSAIAAGQAYTISEQLADLLRKAQLAERESCGLFNAATGNLVRMWGFHTSKYPITGPIPTEQSIQAWLTTQVSSHQLQISQESKLHQLASHPNSNVRFDLSAIAKGAAVELAAQRLHQLQIPAALINAGGDVYSYTTIDQEDKTGTWRIAIRHPFSENDKIIAIIETRLEEAVFTSGNYIRYHESANQRHTHILDPRSGMPVKQVASVTVVHHQAWRADAAATALMVVDQNEPWTQIAQRMGVDMVMLIRHDGQIEVSRPMLERLEAPSQRTNSLQHNGWHIVDFPVSSKPDNCEAFQHRENELISS